MAALNTYLVTNSVTGEEYVTNYKRAEAVNAWGDAAVEKLDAGDAVRVGKDRHGNPEYAVDMRVAARGIKPAVPDWLAPADALAVLQNADEFNDFSRTDWAAYAGVESDNPQIAYAPGPDQGRDYVIILDDTCLRIFDWSGACVGNLEFGDNPY